MKTIRDYINESMNKKEVDKKQKQAIDKVASLLKTITKDNVSDVLEQIKKMWKNAKFEIVFNDDDGMDSQDNKISVDNLPQYILDKGWEGESYYGDYKKTKGSVSIVLSIGNADVPMEDLTVFNTDL